MVALAGHDFRRWALRNRNTAVDSRLWKRESDMVGVASPGRYLRRWLDVSQINLSVVRLAGRPPCAEVAQKKKMTLGKPVYTQKLLKQIQFAEKKRRAG